MVVVSTETIYRYSGLSTDTKPTVNIRDGSHFWETDTDKRYEWRENDWYPIRTLVSIADDNGNAVIDDVSLKLYQDGTYIYVCTASPGSTLTDPVWQIKRLNTTDIAIEWADGDKNYDNVATSLAVVAALTYSL